MTDTLTKPKLSDAPPACWPPVAHIVRKEDLPPREGSVALCGAKLMGIDLGGNVFKATCKQCLAALRADPRVGGQP